ncbi:poly(ethylene terephthalate) hydrolase family protein [Streptomyces sp. NBC_00358]|jgi:predicted dienelactone hydrolase|uniref:poly(ethylene terephthalate) hydrolase family protein n=1 Tax=Streptomyces sp. NBC_00358 TaxID=2975725 RepID=UPI002E25869B
MVRPTHSLGSGARRAAVALLLGLALLAGSGGLTRAEAADSPTVYPTAAYATAVGQDPSDVYYPVSTARRLPVALLLQGANVDKSAYEGYARTVAAFGFVVVVPDHTRTLYGVPGLWASSDEGLTAVAWAAAENGRPDSPLAGRIDPGTLVLLGHSFGGAAGLGIVQGQCSPPFCFGLPAGAVKPAELKAAAFFGTNNVPPGGGTAPAVDNTGVPLALVQGSADGVATPAAAQATYDALTAGPKALVTVTGANHYGVTDVQNPPGALPDTSVQTLDQTESIRTSARWSALFLRASLGDPLAASYVRQWGDAVDSAVTVQQTY